MHVCYFGTYDRDYSRNHILIEGLRANGVRVTQCHVQLWAGTRSDKITTDKVFRSLGGWKKPTFLLRVLRVYAKLTWQYLTMPDHDIVVVGYAGQFDVYLARLLTWLRRKPLILDLFMSLYLIISERGLTERAPRTARLIRWAERGACRLPDMLLLDTEEYVQYFHQLYGIPLDKFRLIPTGADDRALYPVEPRVSRDDAEFRVIFYGKFMPLHGIDTMIRAAHLLNGESDIKFEFIGEGQEKAAMRKLAADLGVANVTFEGWVEKEELPYRVAAADVCLGVFGTTAQSRNTIQNKIYEGMAMCKPVITGDSPTVRRALNHGEHLYLCERDNPRALADAILTLRDDPALCARIARSGHELFRERYTIDALGKLALQHLQEAVR